MQIREHAFFFVPTKECLEQCHLRKFIRHYGYSYTLNSVYNEYVYNDIAVIAIEFHGPGHDASI